MFNVYGLESDAFFRLDSMKVNFYKVENLLDNIKIEKEHLIKIYSEFLLLSKENKTQQTQKVAAASNNTIAAVNNLENAVENIQFFF